jgi:hypothetical protein
MKVSDSERRAKVETCSAVVKDFFDVMDRHRLEPIDALMVATNFTLTVMEAVERRGDPADVSREERAVNWFCYVRDVVAQGDNAVDVGLTGLPH